MHTITTVRVSDSDRVCALYKYTGIPELRINQITRMRRVLATAACFFCIEEKRKLIIITHVDGVGRRG